MRRDEWDPEPAPAWQVVGLSLVLTVLYVSLLPLPLLGRARRELRAWLDAADRAL